MKTSLKSVIIRLTPEQTSLNINNAGKISFPPFEFVQIIPGLNKDRKKVIEIRNTITGELAQFPYTYLVGKKRNPFKKSKYSDLEAESLVNNMGTNSQPPFNYHSMTNETNNNGSKILKVQHSITKEIKDITFTAVMRGTNPWKGNQDRFEEKTVHPLIKDKLHSLGIFSFQYEEFLSKYVKPDFVLKNEHGKILFIEAKTSRFKRKVIRQSINDQLNKYNEFGKSEYGNLFLGTLTISLDGSNHCFSLQDIESKLKEYKFL